MKVAPLIAVALILFITFLGPIQAKKKPKQFCVGKDGNRYEVGKGYVDNEGKVCVQYKCVKEKNKLVMKKGKCESVQWSGIQSKIWGNDQCKNVGNFHKFGLNLADCKQKCLKTATCTAINYNKFRKDCVLRGCTQCVPPPQWQRGNYRGYYIMDQMVDLTLIVTSLEASVVTLLDTVGSLTTKVEAITIKVDANTAKGDANAAALTNKCDATKCTEVETKVTDVESCLSDTTSAKCPTAAGKVSVPGAITALETPTVFSCYNTPAISASGNMAPYGTCAPNVGGVVDLTSGKFTVAKAGKYRLTFMCLMLPLAQKKAIAIMTKTTGVTETKLARSLSQTKNGVEQEQVTTTIDIIAELAIADTVHVVITLSGGATIAASDAEPYQLFFTGEFISA